MARRRRPARKPFDSLEQEARLHLWRCCGCRQLGHLSPAKQARLVELPCDARAAYEHGAVADAWPANLR